uniref:T9SS C-terminal target domain-containing protein n=1 Tax=Anaerophaga thermohalophila TaxID=177400 RepID=UPI000371A544
DPASATITIEDDENPPHVSLSAQPLSISENGGTTNITATLNRRTIEPVVVTLSVSNGSTENEDYQLESDDITIPAGSLSGETTLEAIDDNIYEDSESLTLSISSVSGGDAYENGIQNVTIFILDDEQPPLVTLSASPESIAEDGTSTITASLSNATEQTVIVLLEATNITTEDNDYNLTSTSISISPGSTTGSTTLDAIADNIYEGDEVLEIAISQVAGGSASTAGIQEAAITIEDAQTEPVVNLQLTGSPFTEDGGSAIISVGLNHASTREVSVELEYSGTAAGNDYSGRINSVTIPSGQLEETITLTGTDDFEAEGDETITVSISSASDATIGEQEEVTAIVLDDDIAGIKPIISDAGTTTSESGTSDNISILLNTQPATNVVIEITGLDTSEGTLNSNRLTFTPENWDEPQIITVTGIDDNEVDGDISYTLAFSVVNESSDEAYHNLSVPVEVTNTDNDSAGFDVTITNSETITSESGTTDVFSIVLKSQPFSDVVFEITGLDTSEGILSTDEIIFTPDNWNQQQTIVITGEDDDEVDGDISYTLTVAVVNESSDENYHGQSTTIPVTNTDNDSAGLITIPESLSLETSESGTSDNFSLQLSSRPASTVIIRASGIDETEGTLNNDEFIFTPENWNQPQTVTVTGVDDDEADGDIQFSIEFMVDASASDQNYHDLSFTAEVTNLDNDQTNQPPNPEDDEFEAEQDLVFNGSSLLDNDTDPDGHELSINTVPVSFPENGTVEINPDGTFTYTPNQAFFGTDSFEYEICDNGTPQLCSNATVTITVVEIDDHDGDGIPTEVEGYGDSDGDGTPDYLDPDPCFEVVEGFSPNDDDINEKLIIPWVKRDENDNFSFIVFNRWGNTVYKQDEFTGEWDGTSNAGITIGKKLPSGTYYYVITIRDINKKVSGYFYIVR